jgi:hypothetical protein
MRVDNCRARNALDRAHVIRHQSRAHAVTSRARWKSRATRHRNQQPSEHCSKSAQDADPVDCGAEENIENQRVCHFEEEHYLNDKQSRTIGEWLDLCGIDLDEHGVRWPRDELDGLADLRFQPKQTSGQCVSWQIFKDDRVVHLPSFEDLVPRLDIDSCREAWFLEKPIKLKEDCFADFKIHLLEERVSTIRLLNVPVTKRMVSLHRHGAPERNAFLRPSRVQIRAPKVGDCCSVGMSYVPARRARRLTPALDTRESRDATRRAWQSVVRIPLPFAPSWSYKQSTPSHASVYRCHQLFLALSVTIPAI